MTSTPKGAQSDCSELTLVELLDQIAARQPAPGGGTAAAGAGATAAALVEMAAAFAGTEGQEPLRRAGVLRAQLVDLAQRDTESYAPVLESMALKREDPRRSEALREALSAATDVPLAIATASAEVAELAATVAAIGSVHLLGDTSAAAVLAEASTAAAARLVQLNLAGMPQDPRLRLAAELAERAAARRGELLGACQPPAEK